MKKLSEIKFIPISYIDGNSLVVLPLNIPKTKVLEEARRFLLKEKKNFGYSSTIPSHNKITKGTVEYDELYFNSSKRRSYKCWNVVLTYDKRRFCNCKYKTDKKYKKNRKIIESILDKLIQVNNCVFRPALKDNVFDSKFIERFKDWLKEYTRAI